MHAPPMTWDLPEWMDGVLAQVTRTCMSVEERMRFVIRLSCLNVEHGSGGPFAAAVFEVESGLLVAAGVNRVVPLRCSAAHAEIVALSVAQQVVGSHDLGAPGLPEHELVSSTEPCAMCLGAIPWSGVRRLVCGARDEDARQVGMDEGDKPDDWEACLERRGIAVTRDVCRAEAADVLRAYRDAGGVIYNGRAGAGA